MAEREKRKPRKSINRATNRNPRKCFRTNDIPLPTNTKENERELRQTSSEPKTRLRQKTKTKAVTGKKGTKTHQQKTGNEHKTGTPHPQSKQNTENTKTNHITQKSQRWNNFNKKH